jgi:hypothetical protein
MPGRSPFMHSSAGVYSNAPQVTAWLEDLGEEASRRAHALVVQFTALLETRIKAAASGRPGPRAVTGDYRRSINGRVRVTMDVAIGTVGTASPQARRLEYGFVGADRLGRVYNQPPYPHFSTGFHPTAAEFAAAMARILL